MAEEEVAAAVDEPQMAAPVAEAVVPASEGVERAAGAETPPAPPSDPFADLDDETFSSHARVQTLLQLEREEAAAKAEARTARDITNMARKHLMEGGFQGDVARTIKHFIDSGEEFNPAVMERSIQSAWKGLFDYTMGNVDEFISSFVPDEYAIPAKRERELRAAATKAAQGDVQAANQVLSLRIQTAIDAARADERVKLRAELEPELRKEIDAELRQESARTDEEKQRARPRQTAGAGVAPGTGAATYSNLQEARNLHAQGKLDNQTMRALIQQADRGQFPRGY